jgi:hypothetical protein
MSAGLSHLMALVGLLTDWDWRSACFDKLSMRFFLNATKILPYPEPVEGRTAFV